MTLVAIHQPNFFPWLGYFDKIQQADVFIFLDEVAYPKSSWTNRVRISIQGGAQWLTCPVIKSSIGAPIREALIDESKVWRDRMLKTLNASYKRAPRFDEAMALIAPLLDNRADHIADFNIAAIEAIARALGLKAKFLRQSSLDVAGASNELLAGLVRAVAGDSYLIGGGADGYHDDAVFAAAGIAVVRQNFAQSPYGDRARFIPGLSVIDYLMHDGSRWT